MAGSNGRSRFARETAPTFDIGPATGRPVEVVAQVGDSELMGMVRDAVRLEIGDRGRLVQWLAVATLATTVLLGAAILALLVWRPG